MSKLTIGMPVYDDYDGVYFSINSIRFHHNEILSDIELIVVDNNPDSKSGLATAKFARAAGAKYVPFSTWASTSVGKNLVFEQAKSDYVLCIDSHVMLGPGAISKLIQFYEQHPDCADLLQGPLVNTNFSLSTHFENEWRGHMWGIWGSDPRAADLDAPPFEIEMQGTGLIACRKDGWLGFSNLFRGFGGQAGYIHEKYRQHGRKTLCLPFLRWMHRFGRPEGPKYRVDIVDKFRNYVIGFMELGLDIAPVIDHFQKSLGNQRILQIIKEVEDLIASTMPLVSCITLTYNRLPNAKYLLDETVESFLRQDYPRKELIIVNDCPDQTIIFDHEEVKVINVPQRFATLGEKFNFAVRASSGQYLMIMDDDDISLPWRITMAVDRIGNDLYWQPETHWSLNDGALTFVDQRGKLPAKGIFARSLFDAIGGFAVSSESIDRKFQRNALEYAGTRAVREAVRKEECPYIYRFNGTGSYHHTGHTGKYEWVGTLPVQTCTTTLLPYWMHDYVALILGASGLNVGAT